ncbi:peptidoglycan bridge formation glycyltransferase FemA/FemB family protein [Devosia sp. SD17-2]|uniref:lipid II:glycine glycyltransferase FemX n=1 Tax=Devosia sp. SD17-2 TaxID=2976459 RepID=UPI0023D8A13C|nr:peptidoglycan bridge formation glycyltransferase FemA/FemB family protein [Devosia sp. SD17-2]WEJ34793.1 peptidoglycan bridge formation glycyltransferase FemA/FemB family protein [Devosia sp. SD17-2]
MSVIADRLRGSDAGPRSAPSVGTLPELKADRVSGDAWDQIISAFDEVCQEQMFAFSAVRWPGVTCEPTVYWHNGQIVGGALIMVQPLPLRLAEMAVLKWAPMLADAERPDAEDIRAAMIEAVLAEYSARRRMMVSVLPAASTDEKHPAYLALRRRGFSRGSSLLFPNRYLVRLRLSDAEQRKSLNQKWRYHLNKADKAGLRFERVGADALGTFKQLYAAMTDRKQFPDHSAYETLDALMGVDEKLRPELFLVHLGEECVAGALIFKAGKRAVYLYGATNYRALPVRAGYFMHWHIIRWLRDNTTADWYDLGGTDGFLGLHQFKKGMVGEAGLIRPVPPVVNYADSRRALILGTFAFRARDALQHLRRHVDKVRSPKAQPDQPPYRPEVDFE